MYLFGAVLIAWGAGCAKAPSQATATFNQGAALAGELPMNPLAWRLISVSLNPGDGTMSTLYGNDIAVDYARTHSQHDYPAGAVLSLVTWKQMEDSRWFGAKIPAQVKSVEFVTVSAGVNGSPAYAYEAYTGNPLQKASTQQSATASERIAGLVSTRAAVMP
jgi:hypothetical protein